MLFFVFPTVLLLTYQVHFVFVNHHYNNTNTVYMIMLNSNFKTTEIGKKKKILQRNTATQWFDLHVDKKKTITVCSFSKNKRFMNTCVNPINRSLFIISYTNHFFFFKIIITTNNMGRIVYLHISTFQSFLALVHSCIL